MTLTQIWTVIWPLLAGGVAGIGTVAVTAFTGLGERLSAYLVDRQLESFKHGLETQIEQLRARLAHFTDRGVRSNELEYKAIIVAWEHFVEAHIATYNCVLRAFRHPDFKRMAREDIERYLKNADFSEVQIEQVCDADDKIKMFSKVMEFRLLAIAAKAIFDARVVLRKQGIFIPKEMEAEVESALQFLHETQVARSIAFEGAGAGFDDKTGSFLRDEKARFTAIKEMMRDRILANVN